MYPVKEVFKRDLFEIDNARNLTRDELVATFEPTKPFWRLLSAKNHIVLGSRGSGKTALAKMLSHDHLCALSNERARRIIDSQSFIGVYVPMRVEWVGALKNKPWQNEREAEFFFQWRLNLATCAGFLETAKSCLERYIADIGQRARMERHLCAEISEAWSGGTERISSIKGLAGFLEDLEYEEQQQIARRRLFGSISERQTGRTVAFHTDLFTPLRRAIALSTRAFAFPQETAWLLCLDEAEFLETLHHRILNSHLRGYSGKLVFKITTMPYFHRTLDTNTGVPLDVGHDFEYVYIDQDPVLTNEEPGDEGEKFALTLFNKRARVSGARYRRTTGNQTSYITSRELLGHSDLLDGHESQWVEGSNIMALLRKHASQETKERAEGLGIGTPRFMDQIGRKIRPALLLKDRVLSQRGHTELDVYSGATMTIRIGDANPRRLIRLFNSLLLEVPSSAISQPQKTPLLSKKQQTRILIRFSSGTLSRVQSEPEVGRELYEFIRRVGEYMHHSLYEKPVTTDQVSSFRLTSSVEQMYWPLIQHAVALGLLYPNLNTNHPDQLPQKSGTFHLAYVLAPLFRILPRRGKALGLQAVIRRSERIRTDGSVSGLQQSLFPGDIKE
jgi:hypothetical protein